MGAVAAPDPLAAKIAAADAGMEAPQSAEPAPTAGDPADDSAKWIAAAEQYGMIARELLPERAKPHWTPARLRNVGEQLARCAKHYGWKFGVPDHPLAALALAAAPLAWPFAEPYIMPLLRGEPTPTPAKKDAPAPAPKPSAVNPVA